MEPLRKILAAAAVILAACVAQAQGPHAVKGSVLDSVALPGEFASTSGNLSSYEKGNIVSDMYAEQRAMIFAARNNSLTVTPYVAADFVLDTAGYNWNNKIQPSFGIKVNQHVRAGVLTAGMAYAYENRFRNTDGFKPASGRTDFITGWFGWNDVADKQNRFPGSTWAIAGHYSPVEAGNLMERGHIQQGFVAKRFARNTLIPYAEATLAHDSKRFDWENIAVIGSCMKVGIPTGGNVYTEIGAGYMRETHLISDRTSSGIKIFMNVSYSWNLFGRSSRESTP